MRLFENTAGTEDVFNGIIIAGPEARFEPKVGPPGSIPDEP